MRFDEFLAELEPEYVRWEPYEAPLAEHGMTVMQAVLAMHHPERFPELAGKLAGIIEGST